MDIDKPSRFDEALALAATLTPVEQVRLARRLLSQLEEAIAEKPVPGITADKVTSLYGLLADLGPAPSEEDIDEVRREMMQNFPREDI